MAKLILIFLDGVGIGKSNNTNPFFISKAKHLPFHEDGCVLPDGTPIKAIDAQLGVQGIPMSATGQTTLFTGINAPAVLGEHRDSFPDKEMRKMIKAKSIFTELRKAGKHPRFINAFPGSSYLFSPENIFIRDDGELRMSVLFESRFKRSLSVTTCMMIANMMRPFGENDIRRERSLFHDFSNHTLEERNFRLRKFSPEKAAEILYNVSHDYDLLLYEYFQTDLFGHGFEEDMCTDLIGQLDRLTGHLISLMDSEKDTLLLTSDHGNLEDLLTQLHTHNRVPLLTWGHRHEELRDRIGSLTDIRPAIVDFFKD